MSQRRLLATVLADAIALVFAVVLAAPASAATWRFETLDGEGGPDGRTNNNVGDYSAVTVWSSQPHVWSFDGSGPYLRHAWYD